ncbi:MAG: exonuclease domain-containing protein [Oscillospiraceae bacterium]|jgi:inhibitor of KinA sporulation pathway (predicted exonuclease)
MHYVVLDLEWNQAMSAQSSIFNKLPIRLRGEIIQIGAVKLTEDFQVGEEFQADIKPIYFRRMHSRVKKLTGFDKERLSRGGDFTSVIESFRAWCGDDCTFITWGCDDKDIMEQNIIIHDLDWDWISGWINLQLIYNVQTDGGRNQKALKTAMEEFDIVQTRTAHDALGDAYNTALICTKLDMPTGIENYDHAMRDLEKRHAALPHASDDAPPPVAWDCFGNYTQRADAFADTNLVEIPCPDCGAVLKSTRWVNQGDKRYMSLCTCPEHANFLVRLKFRHAENGLWCANRIVYRADETMQNFYTTKASKNRRRARKRNRTGRKSAPVVAAQKSEFK